MPTPGGYRLPPWRAPGHRRRKVRLIFTHHAVPLCFDSHSSGAQITSETDTREIHQRIHTVTSFVLVPLPRFHYDLCDFATLLRLTQAFLCLKLTPLLCICCDWLPSGNDVLWSITDINGNSATSYTSGGFYIITVRPDAGPNWPIARAYLQHVACEAKPCFSFHTGNEDCRFGPVFSTRPSATLCHDIANLHHEFPCWAAGRNPCGYPGRHSSQCRRNCGF